MTKKKVNKKEESKGLSLDEELLMMGCIRYCVGRKTYMSSLSYFIGHKYYNLLNDNRLLFTSEDIRRTMQDHFGWMTLGLKYSGTVNTCDRKPYEDAIEFLMTEIVKDGDTTEDIQEKLLKIRDVEIYHDKYGDGEPHKYRITYKADGNVRDYISPSDFFDYNCWAELASIFDKKHYKKVHTKFNGEEKDVICIETWIEDCLPVEDKPGYYQWWPWHFKKVYKEVDRWLEKGEMAGYILPEYVVSVEDYDARSEETKAEDKRCGY